MKEPEKCQEKILIVDDEKSIVDLLRIMLRKEGVIECAANGKEALDKLGEKYYSAIISDVNMPVMDGIEFYSRAVEAYPYTRERFLFYSGYSNSEQVYFFEINNLKCLSKSSELKDIKKAVTDILGRLEKDRGCINY